MIEQIRSFNRTVTRRLGVLNDRYLGRDRPLVESRLLFEIGLHGAPVSELRAMLGLDSGFLSRLLRSLERKGLTTTGKHSGSDGRARFARLTRAGRAELRRVNALSDELARSMLAPLTESQVSRLVSAMSEVERLLRASSVELASADPLGPDAQYCLAQYFAELVSRFKEGFDPEADGAAAVEDFVPPNGGLLIARLYGEPVGCGALRTLHRGMGEIKRLWISPDVRGLSLGRRLLEELERAARKHKMHAVRLDTHESLHEAIRLYQTAGYREIDRFNDNPHAHRWFEKTLTG